MRSHRGSPARKCAMKAVLVGLKMPRAIEILNVTLRRLERGEMTAIEAQSDHRPRQ
jgi:hypothetical protein